MKQPKVLKIPENERQRTLEDKVIEYCRLSDIPLTADGRIPAEHVPKVKRFIETIAGF